MRRRWLFGLLAAIGVKGVAAQPVQSTTMYLPDRIRDDFTVSGGPQAVFVSNGPVRSNYVEVYKNGLLQRAGASADYVGVSINNRYQITFNPNEVPTPSADLPTPYVTLFYWR